MRWKAHTRTAEMVLKVFDAMHFSKYEKDLVNGIISPDNHFSSIPAHPPESGTIRLYS